MKFNSLEIRGKKAKHKVFGLLLIVLVFLSQILIPCCNAVQEIDLNLRAPKIEEESDENIPATTDVKKIPDFPNLFKSKGTTNRISISATTIPINTRLRLIVDNFVDAKESMLGDYFRAHILEDFYIPSEPPQLIIPKGSWVRGRVSFLKKPGLFSMAGKIGLHLDQIATPLGDITPLDAELDLQQGIVNQQGFLDPMTNFGTKAIEPTQMLLESQVGKVITAVTLGSPLIGTLIGGSLVALFSHGDNISLYKGQELQILLKKELQLTIN